MRRLGCVSAASYRRYPRPVQCQCSQWRLWNHLANPQRSMRSAHSQTRRRRQLSVPMTSPESENSDLYSAAWTACECQRLAPQWKPANQQERESKRDKQDFNIKRESDRDTTRRQTSIDKNMTRQGARDRSHVLDLLGKGTIIIA